MYDGNSPKSIEPFDVVTKNDRSFTSRGKDPKRSATNQASFDRTLDDPNQQSA